MASPVQSTTLRSFRGALERGDLLVDGHRDDITLCRFLRARKWDEDKALEMWRAMRSWRVSNAILPAVDTAVTDAEKHAVLASCSPHETVYPLPDPDVSVSGDMPTRMRNHVMA